MRNRYCGKQPFAIREGSGVRRLADRLLIGIKPVPAAFATMFRSRPVAGRETSMQIGKCLPYGTLALVVVALASQQAAAQGFMSQDFIAPGEESLTIDLGGIFNQFDTSVRLDGQGTRGTDINLEGNGLEKNLSSFEGALTWRFFPRHRLDVQYFSAKRSGSRDYTGEIDIGGTTFPVGATVSASAKDDFVFADYRYSFVKKPGFEVAGLLGFWGGKFTYDINATGSGLGGAQAAYNKSVSTTLPLPLLGATFDWYPDRRWKASLQFQGMKAKVGDVDGHAYLAGASSEYMLVRNFGLGLRYLYTDFKADVTKSDFNGHLGWRMNSLSLYGKLVF
jgi:hypothetical protein